VEEEENQMKYIRDIIECEKKEEELEDNDNAKKIEVSNVAVKGPPPGFAWLGHSVKKQS
jgi:hypothetical protein